MNQALEGKGGISMNHNALLAERNRLLTLYTRARGEERIRILARLVVLDEEMESKKAKQDYFKKNWSLRNKKESEVEHDA